MTGKIAAQAVYGNLEGLIHSVISNGLNEDDIIGKVQGILENTPFICSDPNAANLFTKLQVSLDLCGLKTLSQKVDRILVTRKQVDQTILHFHNALKTFQDGVQKGVEGFTAHELFHALENLSGWENCLETRSALLDLKWFLEEREKKVGVGGSWKFSILGGYYSAEPYLLQLLQGNPEKFGLKKEQIEKTVKMSAKAGAEGVRFLLLNRKKILHAGIFPSFFQSEVVNGIRTALDTDSKTVDVLVDCLKAVYFVRAVKIKCIKPLSKEECDRFTPIFLNYEVSDIKKRAKELGLTEEERDWILSNVEIEGLPKDIAFSLITKLLERGDESNASRLISSMGTLTIREKEYFQEGKTLKTVEEIERQMGEVLNGRTIATNTRDGSYHSVSRQRRTFDVDQILELAAAIQGHTILRLADQADPEMFTQDELFSFAKILREKGAHFCAERDCLWGIARIENQERRMKLLKTSISQNPELVAEMCCTPFFKDSKEEILASDVALGLFFDGEKNLPEETFLNEPFKSSINSLQEKKGAEKDILAKWLGYVLILREETGLYDIGKLGSVLFQKIEKLRPPSLRYKMTKYLWVALQTPSLKKTLELIEEKKILSQKFTHLFKLVLLPLFQEDQLIKLVEILNYEYYNDAEKRRIAIQSLFDLIENPSCTHREKIAILQAALPEQEKLAIEKEETSLQREKNACKKELFDIQKRQAELQKEKKRCAFLFNQNLQIVSSLLNMKQIDALKNAKSPQDLATSLKELFQEVTGARVENILEKYLETFAKSRNPYAIFVYGGCLRNLEEKEKEPIFSCLKACVESVLDGVYATNRYKETAGDHLSTVFEGRKELKELWMKGETISYLSLVPDEEAGGKAFDVQEFLTRSICLDRHIDPAKLSFLSSYLETKDERKLSDLSAALQREQSSEQRNLLTLQRGLFLLLDKTKTQEEKASIFSSYVKRLIDSPALSDQFKADLLDLETILTAKKGQKKDLVTHWTVVDTDHWEDMLLCGVEVLGSCQNINGSSMNKCLLGYLVDGKNRMIAVKDEQGKILARSIFRILWDKIEKKPVLFLERCYQAAKAPSNLEKVLEKMAIKRGEALGLSVVSKEKPHHNPIVSLGSKAPFEYVDAATGVTNGEYKIER
jgi:hypothetical protein